MCLLACGPEDGATYGSSSQSIIDGHVCVADEQPATVAVLAHFTVEANNQQYRLTAYICTGTLIAADTVLTAAHCVDLPLLSANLLQNATILEAKFFISYQENLQNASNSVVADAVNATSVHQHPDFTFTPADSSPFQRYSDLALLFLEKAQSVRPEFVIAANEADQVFMGKEVETGGWGQESGASNPPASSDGLKRCASTTIAQVATFELQVGTSSTPRQCHGDSGGPTYLDVNTTTSIKRRVIGVTSHAYDASDCANGGVDTRVDAYLDWLDRTMSDACKAKERVACQTPGLPSPYPAKAGCGCGSGNGNWLALFALLAFAQHRRGLRPRRPSM